VLLAVPVVRQLLVALLAVASTAIAAAALPALLATLLGAVALGSYSLLLFFYQPLPALMPVDEHAAHLGTAATAALPNLHSVGMWFNFAISAALVIYFVVKLSTELRRREDRLRQYREETLRNEQILAVATQAAGTAHALGTPLGTMAVLLGELQQEHKDNPGLAADIHTLQGQLNHCRSTLQTLVQKADFKQQQVRRVPVAEFVGDLLQQWQLLRERHQDHLSITSASTLFSRSTYSQWHGALQARASGLSRNFSVSFRRSFSLSFGVSLCISLDSQTPPPGPEGPGRAW
jgi:two-component system sensor histidine kinase RegB